MTLTRMFAALAAFATTALLFAAPASAQATRTWVSGVGDDANPCSRTAPCKTFAGAISKTAPAGEIECLDPGGFGALTITKSITINCAYVVGRGGVLVSGTNGIVVAGGTQVQLIGLDIDGITTGINGVLINAANVNVAIIDCVIYEFQTTGVGQGAGVSVTGAGSRVFIQSSIIRNNTVGVNVAPGSGSNQAVIERSTLDNNATTNLSLTGTTASVILNDSTLTDSGAIQNPGPGAVVSYGNNQIRPAGGVTQTLPLQ